jgi:hypothetical protein
MKYATVGKENRKVYRVEEPKQREVTSMVDGEEETNVELKIPTASSHREIIEISNAKATRIAATEGDHTAIWFIQPDGTLESLEERQALIVPESVTRRGLRKALLDDGITFADIRIQLENITDAAEREDALIDLDDAQTIHRNHPLVAGIGAMLSKSSEQLDNYFILARPIDS